MQKVRWGLLSTANINRWLIPAIRLSTAGELTAVASRSAEKAAEYAREWEIPHAFGSYAAMLESDAVDAVYISLPNHLHAEWSLKAMQHGKHVLCEKPFALSLEEVDQMIATAQETGTALAEAFMYRHHPQTRIVGEWVRSGRLGEISVVRGAFNIAFRTRDNIRLVPEWGGGCLWDVGVYPVSFAQFIMGGRPERVAGDQWLGDTGVDESFVGQLHYSGDRLAQITCSFRTPFYTSAEIIGTEGRLILNRPFVRLQENGYVRFYDREGNVEEIAVPEKHLYLGEVEDLHNAILHGEPNTLSLAETRNHVRTVLALYASARTGEIVHL